MKPLFLQPYDQQSIYGQMVDEYRSRHAKYCQMHNYVFLTDPNSNITGDWSWNKVFLIKKYIHSGEFSHIFWMDADVIIVDLKKDMRDTLPENKWLGLVKHRESWHANYNWHYNTGVMYIKCCKDSLDFFDTVCSWFYNDTRKEWIHKDEQAVIMHLLANDPSWIERMKVAIEVLPCHWNANYSFGEFDSKQTIVMGFHGTEPDRFKLMKQFFHSNVKKLYKIRLIRRKK